ncbi:MULTISPECIES: hypothetical protein [unclassified Sphingomonas]|uniref:hypothetical protein n=1 Tax=unclassified Sphingomonas TaxID=196159 RepID=UPI0006FC80EB|nr:MULTISPECIES: hypothetical protein [unclassified Sphingomonas]KQM65362.1 hypothetical protein ASE65_14985 [Sphingomonas sp. Leaf16]KQN16965.1 hypothetical protein ASE83_14965 [Sphingomonas sp. Leaf32]KQN17138.1 hypothetical protein ASE81_15030 [Sphingomonas sp. Leaf29]
MEATFSIVNDAPRGLMRITMAGFFAEADIARFVAARDRELAALGTRANEHLTLVDIRAMDIQAAQSVAAFQQLLADPRTASRRIAFLVGRSLAAMQIRRAAQGRDTRYFAELDEAEDWLLATHPTERTAYRAG